MKIIINGENTEVQATALDQLLVELGYGDSRVATAVNGVFVAQGHRADCTLNEADRLEVVTPRQGECPGCSRKPPRFSMALSCHHV